MSQTQNDIKFLSDNSLFKQTRDLVQRERETTTETLHLLREIERRKLYSAYACSSLFDFCTRLLGYSESSAQRRIASMRLLREIPEIESKIRSGELSLSVVSHAQSFFRTEAKIAQGLSLTEKREVLSALQGKSMREAERELLSRSSQPMAHQRERMRAVNETQTEFKIILSNEAVADLEKLKGLLAHSHPNLNMGELIALIAKMALERLDPGSKPKRKTTPPQKSELPAQKPSEPLQTAESPQLQTPASPKLQTSPSLKRHIPRPLRREVFERDQNECTNCKSRFALEADHYPKPFAQGGPTTLENLRVLCRSCNRRHAIETYGIGKIEGAGFENFESSTHAASNILVRD